MLTVLQDLVSTQESRIPPPPPPWHLLICLFFYFFICRVLFFAMALSYGTKDFIEGGVITAVVALNVVIGFWQEYNA